MSVVTTLAANAPQNRPIILSQSGVPVGIPSSGSIGNNGALTLTTAFLTTYSGGIFLYYPANAIFTGSVAGLYWAVMSSTTAGTIYNNTYTSGDPVIPASPTAFATTGPGAYTQSTSEITLRSVTVPGGMMGPNGSLRVMPFWTITNNANGKTLKVAFDATQVLQAGPTSTATAQIPVLIRNRGSQTSQVTYPGSGATSTAAAVVTTKDTSTDRAIAFTAQLSNAADYVIVEGSTIEVLPS